MSIKSFFKHLNWLMLLFLVVIIATCKKEPQNQNESPRVSFDSTNNKVITVDSSGTQTTILSNGIKYTLTISRSAVNGLDTVKRIILKPINNIDNLPIAKNFVAAIYFKADSILFRQPVDLKIEFPNAVTADQIVGFAYDNISESYYRFPIFPENISSKSVTFSLTHFSGYGFGTGNMDAQKVIENSKKLVGEISYQDQLEGIITAAMNNRDNIDFNAVKEILKEWFNQLPTPSKYSDIDNYTLKLNSWRVAVEQFGLEADFKDNLVYAVEKISELINNEYSHVGNEFGNAATSCEDKKKYLTDARDIIIKAQVCVHMGLNINEPNIENFNENAINRFPISIMMSELSQFPKFANVSSYCILTNILGSEIEHANDMVSWSSSDLSSVSFGNSIDGNLYSSEKELQLNKTNGASMITATATFDECILSATGTQEVLSPVDTIRLGGFTNPWPKDVYTVQFYAIVKVHPKLVSQGFASIFTGTNQITWPNGYNSDITWSSSDGSFMTVDNYGLVTWSGNYGSTVISATCEGLTKSKYWESVEGSKNGQPTSRIIEKN